MHVEEEFDEEVGGVSGERYAQKNTSMAGRGNCD